MAECLIHRTGSMFKAFINVTGTPNSTVTATIGSKSFNGTTNAQGVATILVKKKGTYTVTSSASGTQTKTVEVTESKQTYSVNISGKFTISISHTNSAVSVMRNSSPYAGASTGALGNGAIVYYGDTFTVTGTANDGFDTWTKTVTGATANGNIYTVTGNVTVSTTASPIIYMLLIDEGTGTTITVRRKTVGVPGMVAGAETGDLVHNSAIYKGDVLEATAVASATAYETPTLNLENPSNYTVVGDTTVSATTTVKKYTLTISENANNDLVVKRTASPYQGASTDAELGTLSSVYYYDTLSVTNTLSAGYTGTKTVTGLDDSNRVITNVKATSTASKIPYYPTWMDKYFTGYYLVWTTSGDSGKTYSKWYSFESKTNGGNQGTVATVSGSTSNVLTVYGINEDADDGVWGIACKFTNTKIDFTNKSKITLTFYVNQQGGGYMGSVIKIGYTDGFPVNGSSVTGLVKDIDSSTTGGTYYSTAMPIGKSNISGHYNSNDIGKNTTTGKTVTMTRSINISGLHYLCVYLDATGGSKAPSGSTERYLGGQVTLQNIVIS